MKLAAEASWVRNAVHVNPPWIEAAPPALPCRIARLSTMNRGRLIQKRILKI